MEQEIIKYLRELFNPTAIILHGSRASGHERPHSDWDFVLLYTEGSEVPEDGRSEMSGENIEYSHHTLPVTDVMKEFSVKLQNARVVYEEESVGTEILERAQAACREPLAWTAEEKYSHSLWVRGRINGMKDALDHPLIFEKYAADFYGRITNYWYWAIHDKYPKPIYLALEEISEKDSEYFSLIEQFVYGKNEEKVASAEKIFEWCFEK